MTNIKKKIIIVDNSSWNIYNFRLPHARKFAKMGYEVVVATPIDEFISYLEEPSVFKHVPIKHLFPQQKNPFQDILFFFELLKIYREEKPDLIIQFTVKPNIYGSIAARLLGLPAICVITGLGYPFLHPKGLNKLVPKLYKLAFKKIHKLVVYNHDDKAHLVNNHIIAEEKCVIIPGSGVNTQNFRPSETRIENNNIIFLFIGRLLKDKGIIEFVEAARQLKKENPKLEFHVLGNFAYSNPSAVTKDQLFDWVEEGVVKYLGFSKDTRSYIEQASVMVLPSHRGEGVPRSILEAMAMGKPVITTDTAGCRDTVVHGENGYLVPVNNTEALTLAMSTLSNLSTDSILAMGKESRIRAVTLFDEKIITDAYLKLLDELFRHETKTPSDPVGQKLF
ncbi:MAG: glycosyltransferase family 4 protein [Saprospiraceae bacterium]|nr:glycosyltransferase family 4 protein [Saprospiraceae bacterium]